VKHQTKREQNNSAMDCRKETRTTLASKAKRNVVVDRIALLMLLMITMMVGFGIFTKKTYFIAADLLAQAERGSIQNLTRLAKAEGLTAHAASARIRESK
jgi:hypothetical protein